MTILLGNLALVIALIASATAVLAALTAGRFASPRALKVARVSVMTILGGFTLAALALVGALVDSDFRLDYVGRFTERALPTGYKLAAFWAGQEGSLMLWGWLIAAMAVIAIVIAWRRTDTEQAVTTGALAVICGFFAALILFAANPFTLTDQVPVDGHGLNPMLQDPGMIAHPPLLFLGYAGFTIPFAIMFGALATGRRDNHWVGDIRRWALAAWLFLTVGILLGAQWAYVELGWGGYWAWDPVENASLLPWLTGTALLHSIMAQQQRGMLKAWNAILIALTFVLCIFGTYITRSGIVDSVHTFGKSLVGTFFLVFLLGTIAISALLIFARRRLLKPEHALETAWGREGAFVVANVLLLVMTAVTTVGTIFPVISNAFTGRAVSVSQPFYNKVVVPMGLCLMALMAAGPLLNYGRGATEHLKKHLPAPLLGGLLTAAIVALTWRVANGWALLTAFIIGVASVSLAWDLVVTVTRRARGNHENLALATIRTLDANHRRYGGQTVHVGMLMIMVGIAGSSIYGTKNVLQLSPNDTKQVAGNWHVTLDKVDEVRGPNYAAVEASVRVTDPRTATDITLRPQRRFYDKAEDSNSEVAIDSTFRRDAYVTLAGWENGGRLVALELYVNPLVAWLWIGGIVITAGTLLCLAPRLIPRPAATPVALAPEPKPTAKQNRRPARRPVLQTTR